MAFEVSLLCDFDNQGRDDQSFEKFYVSPDNKHLIFPGRDGHMSILSRETKQWIADLKMNTNVKAIDFSKDGRNMYSFGGDLKLHEKHTNNLQKMVQFTHGTLT